MLDNNGDQYYNWSTIFKLHCQAYLVIDQIIPSSPAANSYVLHQGTMVSSLWHCFINGSTAPLIWTHHHHQWYRDTDTAMVGFFNIIQLWKAYYDEIVTQHQSHLCLRNSKSNLWNNFSWKILFHGNQFLYKFNYNWSSESIGGGL